MNILCVPRSASRSKSNTILKRYVNSRQLLSVSIITVFLGSFLTAYAHSALPAHSHPAEGWMVALSFAFSIGIVVGILAIADYIITKLRTPRAPMPSGFEQSFWHIVRDFDWFPSLSRLQFFAWTAVVLFTYLFITLIRILAGAGLPDGLSENILILMGISIASPITAAPISHIKYPQVNPNPPPPNPLPGFATMLEEHGKPSVSRVQMFAWTWIGIIVYVSILITDLSEKVGDVNVLKVPDIDPMFLVLMGISQTAYISGKVVSKTSDTGEIYPSPALAESRITIVGSGFENNFDTVWFETTAAPPTTYRLSGILAAGGNIVNWQKNRIDVQLPPVAKLQRATYEVKVQAGGKIITVGKLQVV